MYAEFGIGMWKRVAEYVQKHLKEPIRDENGNIISSRIGNHQCGERYKHHLDPSIKQRKSGPWSEEEVSLILVRTGIHYLVLSRLQCYMNLWLNIKPLQRVTRKVAEPSLTLTG